MIATHCHVLRGWRRRIWALVLLSAWAAPTGAQELVVRDIRVEGLQRISEGTVFNYLPVNIGDRLDRTRIQEALRAVYATEFFKDVEIRWDEETLILAVSERPSIESFTIEGNKDIKTEDLEEPLARIGLKTGRIFNRSVLDEVEQSLTDQYFSQGKYAARVTTEVEELPDNKVSIAIKIKEGDRARIRQINIVGNTVYKDKKLLDDFSLRTPHLLSFIRQDDRYSREALSGDLETLRSYYMDRGHADFRIDSTQVAIAPDKRDIYITINISEGERYKIDDVRLAGDLVIAAEELNPYVLVKPGQTYSQRLITQSADLIRLRLGEEGYAFATVEPVPELDRDGKLVSVTLYVEPRNRVYVRRINFRGADSVNDEVFRREMRQFEGGYLSNSRVERSKVRLQRLPYIESVDVATNPVPGTPDLVDVDFDIKEGLPGQFGGGVGFSEAQGLILNGNFVHTNFLGTGNRIAADINTGKYRTIYSLSHTNPYATVNEVSRTVSFAYRDITNFTSDASDFETQTLSASVEFGYPISEFQRLVFGLTWNGAELAASEFSTFQAKEWVLQNGSLSFINENTVQTKFDTFELVTGWIWDNRNRALFATRGGRQRLLFSATIPGSDVEYYTATWQGRQYIPFTRYFTWSLNAEVSYGDVFGDTTSIPPYKRFFAGGPDTVRGFRENSLGPRDNFGNPYGGNLLIAGQAELILPLPEKWSTQARLALFYDFGQVYDTGGVTFFERDGVTTLDYGLDSQGLRHSVGVGVQWLAPLGLFRFSFGFPLNSEDGDDRIYGDETEGFQFSIGGAF
ncbi:MAG: outer membrane protein assembly factor BamA [Gammaproteobacteria bacterium]|nr:outer membrane protein assembly factor BamA [Gammaproteobacteria bacterium]